jgi:energy-coupling factor transporter ATP-binding protein EcfA2
MTDAVLTEKLTKSYGERRGVFDLDLAVSEGEIFGFLGPNGAGKSTTIRLLLDLIRPASGRALVFGHDCRAEAPEVHRLTGYLPGEFALDAKLTGRQLLTYLGNLRGGLDWGFVDTIVKRLELDLDRPFGGVLARQQAESWGGSGLHAPPPSADPRRTYGWTRSAQPGGCPGARPRSSRRGGDSVLLIAHPERG